MASPTRRHSTTATIPVKILFKLVGGQLGLGWRWRGLTEPSAVAPDPILKFGY